MRNNPERISQRCRFSHSCLLFWPLTLRFQMTCFWLVALVKRCSASVELKKRLSSIQKVMLKFLGEPSGKKVCFSRVRATGFDDFFVSRNHSRYRIHGAVSRPRSSESGRPEEDSPRPDDDFPIRSTKRATSNVWYESVRRRLPRSDARRVSCLEIGTRDGQSYPTFWS